MLDDADMMRRGHRPIMSSDRAHPQCVLCVDLDPVVEAARRIHSYRMRTVQHGFMHCVVSGSNRRAALAGQRSDRRSRSFPVLGHTMYHDRIDGGDEVMQIQRQQVIRRASFTPNRGPLAP